MKLKFKERHLQWSVDEVAEVEDGIAIYLVRLGIADEVKKTKELKKTIEKSKPVAKTPTKKVVKKTTKKKK